MPRHNRETVNKARQEMVTREIPLTLSQFNAADRGAWINAIPAYDHPVILPLNYANTIVGL